MSLGSDVAAALPGLRAEAETRMFEVVEVGTFTDGVDPDTGAPTRVLEDARYEGKGRIRYGSRDVSNSDGTGSPVVVQSPYLSVPFGSPRLHDGDQVRVASSPDPLLADRWFTVAGSAGAGQVAHYKYPLSELG